MVSKPIHVAICSTSFYEYDRRLQRISKTLSESGYKITWLSRQKENNSKPLDYLNHHIITTKRLRGPLFYKEYNDRLTKALHQLKPDIINSVDLDTIIGCHQAYAKLGNRLTHDAHEIYYEVPELLHRPIKKGIWKVIARKYLPTIKTNYTVNNSLKRHYENKYGQAYEVIRNVPSANQIVQTNAIQRTNNKRLIYLGVLNKGRGIEIAIATMKKLPDYHLQLIGEGDDSQHLRKLAQGQNNIEFLGFRQPQELSAILSKASIGLNILLSESLNYKLSLANKFFDYMHSGLPSINMNYPEYEHILNQYRVGIMIDHYDSNALHSAIRRLENPELYSQLTENTNAARKDFTWEQEQKKLIRLYANL